MTENKNNNPTQINETPLESWKEIAAYLKRDVCTVKRWEKSEALPVRRHLHQARSSVYAYPSELEAWKAARQPGFDQAPLTMPWRRPIPALGFALTLLLALISVASGPILTPANAANGEPGDDSGPVARLLLSQQDTNMNHFLSIRPSPDGRLVVYSAIDTAEGALYVRELESGKTTKLTSGELTFYPVWSPDGKRIAYFVYPPDSKLAIVELESRKSSVLKGSDVGELRPLDWSPRGDQLLCHLIRSDKTLALVLVSVPEGEITPLISQGWTAQSTAVFSPDGRFIAFPAIEEGNRHIFMLAVDGSRKHRITTGPEGGWAPLFSPEGDTLVFQNDDGMWATAISDGRPHGRPRFLQSRPFDQPVAWTPTLGYTYVAYNRVAAFYSVPVDPQVGEDLWPAERIPVKLDQAHKFAWSPDMKWIALTRYGDAKIHLYSTTEQTLRSFSTGIERPPSKLWWSGDGKAVLFVPYPGTGRGGTVMVLDPASGSLRSLFPRMTGAGRFDVSPDDRSLLFYRHNGDRNNGRRQLIVGPVGRPEDGRVLASEQDADGLFSNWVRPVFSPDGAQVLLARRSPEKDNLWEESLWVVSTDGSSKRKIASLTYGGSNKPFLHYAVWHPSGRYIAYDDGKSLFVVNVETTEQKQISLPKNFAGIGVMQWSPDGKQIGLVSERQNLELWTVENFLPKPETKAARLEDE